MNFISRIFVVFQAICMWCGIFYTQRWSVVATMSFLGLMVLRMGWGSVWKRPKKKVLLSVFLDSCKSIYFSTTLSCSHTLDEVYILSGPHSGVLGSEGVVKLHMVKVLAHRVRECEDEEGDVSWIQKQLRCKWKIRGQVWSEIE